MVRCSVWVRNRTLQKGWSGYWRVAKPYAIRPMACRRTPKQLVPWHRICAKFSARRTSDDDVSVSPVGLLGDPYPCYRCSTKVLETALLGTLARSASAGRGRQAESDPAAAKAPGMGCCS